MAYKIEKVDVYVGLLKDQSGSLADKLEILADAGANLQFVIGRRDKPGKGIVFMTPLAGRAQLNAAKKARLKKSPSLQSLRIEGPDRPGLGAKITRAMSDAGINLRGLSAACAGGRCVVNIAFDDRKDMNKASQVLKKLLKV